MITACLLFRVGILRKLQIGYLATQMLPAQWIWMLLLAVLKMMLIQNYQMEEEVSFLCYGVSLCPFTITTYLIQILHQILVKLLIIWPQLVN